MKIRTQERGGLAIMYILNLSAKETEEWATSTGASWPCSTLRGHRLWMQVDQNGLCDIRVDGKYNPDNIDRSELAACVEDHLPDDYKHLWPVWGAE